MFSSSNPHTYERQLLLTACDFAGLINELPKYMRAQKLKRNQLPILCMPGCRDGWVILSKQMNQPMLEQVRWLFGCLVD